MILLADTSKQKFESFHAKGKISPWTICWGLKLTWQPSQQDLHQKLQRNSRSALPSSQPWRPHRSCSRLECESQNCFSAANLIFANKRNYVERYLYFLSMILTLDFFWQLHPSEITCALFLFPSRLLCNRGWSRWPKATGRCAESDSCSVWEGSKVSTLAKHSVSFRVTLLFCFYALREYI